MDGKGIYVGESSRLMYECGKEHEKNREELAEESHQIKHWLLDHPELEYPPKVQVCHHLKLWGSSYKTAIRVRIE